MCGCEFNVAGAGGTIAGAVHGHFSSRSDISAIYHSALAVGVDRKGMTSKIMQGAKNCSRRTDWG